MSTGSDGIVVVTSRSSEHDILLSIILLVERAHYFVHAQMNLISRQLRRCPSLLLTSLTAFSRTRLDPRCTFVLAVYLNDVSSKSAEVKISISLPLIVEKAQTLGKRRSEQSAIAFVTRDSRKSAEVGKAQK